MRLRPGLAMMAAGFLAAGLRAQAADVNADLPVLSAYVWRGQVLNDEAVLQPALNALAGNWGFNAWGSYNLTDRVTDDPDFSEIDLTVSYGRRVGPLAVSGGLIEYLFPNTAYPGTRELYLGVSAPDLPVVPALTVYRDIDEADGFYGTLALSKSLKVAEKATLTLCGSVGAADADYNAFYFGVDDAALNDLCAGVSLACALTDRLTLTPGLTAVWLPDSDLRGAARGLYRDDDQVVASLKLNVVF